MYLILGSKSFNDQPWLEDCHEWAWSACQPLEIRRLHVSFCFSSGKRTKNTETIYTANWVLLDSAWEVVFLWLWLHILPIPLSRLQWHVMVLHLLILMYPRSQVLLLFKVILVAKMLWLDSVILLQVSNQHRKIDCYIHSHCHSWCTWKQSQECFWCDHLPLSWSRSCFP